MGNRKSKQPPATTGAEDGGEAALGFPDELAYLAQMKRALAKALEEADSMVERYDLEYRAHQKYMMEHRAEIDPKEIFQNTLSLFEMDKAGAFEVRLRDKIARLSDSPYFARIDFHTGTADIPSSVYIGPFSFAEDEDHVIYDWRAPISGMFYDCEVGPAFYEAPAGRVEGDLTRKRQFRIAGGEMQYCLESSVHIVDDVLQRELSQTSDDRMKTIIATIQREQNRVIRNEQAQALVIQGVAGSGKTSIALHRIAYLLYRQKDRLSAKNVVILSPNRVFGDYIGGVLPELGEEPIYQMSFADIAAVQLDGVIRFAPAPDPVEADDPAWAERTRFKSTIAFLQKMDAYLEMAADQYFVPTAYACGGLCAPADYIQERYRAYRKHPVKRRLLEIADDILERFRSQSPYDRELPRQRTVARQLAAMFKMKNTLALYRDFYKWLGAPRLFRLADKNTLEWADVYPFLYFHAAFAGLVENRVIRHLVIDEMQDYTPAQYAVMNLLFRCPKTILGDYGQMVDPCQFSTLEDFRQLYEDVEIVRLHTSYRSSYEIITFARRILDISDIRPVERHGEPVDVVCCADAQEETGAVRAKIDAFRQSGRGTMGIILKTHTQAKALYQRLCSDYDLHLLDADSVSYAGGISVTSVRMSKGLEFDEVVVAGADEENYSGQLDRNLLYIACTRAMHKLSLTCHGQPAAAILEAASAAGQPPTG